ncbi:MAG: uroporphyrinogen decarboxylase family protein [Nitrososphaeria archaeon]
MDSKSLVINAIEFSGPVRVPLWFTELNESDVIELQAKYVGGYKRTWDPFNGVSGFDEWGCYWSVPLSGEWRTMGVVTGHPMEDWSNLESYRFPKFKIVLNISKSIIDKDKYIVGSVPFTLFERMHFLRGFKNLLTDFYICPEKVSLLADYVLDVQLGLVKQWCEIGVDGLFFTDDWGSQQGLFVSPNVFRQIFKPRYKILFDTVHAYGVHAILHSDGKIHSIIGDFIDIGLDVINIPQPTSLFSLPFLSENFGGKICFLTNVDNQTTIYCSEDKIRLEAKEIVEYLGKFNGGLIAGWIDPCDTIALKVPLENIRIACNAFKEFGLYSKRF